MRELSFLPNDSEDALINELRRIAHKLNKESFSRNEFDKAGGRDSEKIKDIIGWNNALNSTLSIF